MFNGTGKLNIGGRETGEREYKAEVSINIKI